MVLAGKSAPNHELMARELAAQARDFAKRGRKAESLRLFRKAFEEVREMRASVGSLKSDVHERSKLATVLADEAYSAGMSAAFAVEMWKHGCNSGCLSDDERGDTDMFYPVEIMAMAAEERKGEAAGNGMAETGNGSEEDAAPPAVCVVEKEKRIPLPWPLRAAMSAWQKLFFGDGEAGERERTGKNE